VVASCWFEEVAEAPVGAVAGNEWLVAGDFGFLKRAKNASTSSRIVDAPMLPSL
jgi:hypothetical protein